MLVYGECECFGKLESSHPSRTFVKSIDDTSLQGLTAAW